MKKFTNADFVRRAKSTHGDKYDYSKIMYKNSHDKVEIICSNHGTFYQPPYKHMAGQGCPQCNKNVGRLKKTFEHFIAQSNKIHGTRYDYTKCLYKDTRTKVEIICPKHGSFWQIPAKHMCGNNCPQCVMTVGEERIYVWLNNHKIPFRMNVGFDSCRNPATGRKLRFDFYIPSRNVLIEFDGKQHYEHGCVLRKYTTTMKDLENSKKRDEMKTMWAMQSGYMLLRIPYWELRNIENILEELL